MTGIAVTLKQRDTTTSIATIRNHQIVMDRPEAKGGHNVGPMGAEVLLASLGGCFMSNLRAAIVARDNRCVSGIALSSTATVATDAARFSAIHMRVIAEADPNQRQSLLLLLTGRVLPQMRCAGLWS